jgi:hypothetical protein
MITTGMRLLLSKGVQSAVQTLTGAPTGGDYNIGLQNGFVIYFRYNGGGPGSLNVRYSGNTVTPSIGQVLVIINESNSRDLVFQESSTPITVVAGTARILICTATGSPATWRLVSST